MPSTMLQSTGQRRLKLELLDMHMRPRRGYEAGCWACTYSDVFAWPNCTVSIKAANSDSKFARQILDACHYQGIGHASLRGCNSHVARQVNRRAQAALLGGHSSFEAIQSAMAAMTMGPLTISQPARMHAQAFTTKKPVRSSCRQVCRASNDQVKH